MNDNKNISPEEKKDLKHADMNRFGTESLDNSAFGSAEIVHKERTKEKQQIRGERAAENKKSRNIPLALDITIAVVVVLFAAALVVGIYFMFQHYTAGYKNVDIEYTVAIEDGNFGLGEDLTKLKEKDVYLDFEGNSLYFGKITDVKVKKSHGGTRQVTVSITTDSEYKEGEGYSVDGHRIAVGSEYCLRIDQTEFDATVVELVKGGNK
ncbi:MAG: hypothetical protein E7667_00395 [Ruminococcaceae bacterium]|nr:hypothetical protein [Oscillospiraceae bacterium]